MVTHVNSKDKDVSSMHGHFPPIWHLDQKGGGFEGVVPKTGKWGWWVGGKEFTVTMG